MYTKEGNKHNALASAYYSAKRIERQAKLVWGVYSVLKSGKVSKHEPVLFATEKEAIERAANMEKWNPGRKFVVQHI